MDIPLTPSFVQAPKGPGVGRQKSRSIRLPAKAEKGQTQPFSLRLTFEERAALQQAAGDLPLGCYIRNRILGDNEAKPRRQRRAPVADQAALAKVLAVLGQSRLSNNLNQLARAVNSGSLPVTPDTDKAIREACADVRHMRMELLRALGLSPGI